MAFYNTNNMPSLAVSGGSVNLAGLNLVANLAVSGGQATVGAAATVSSASVTAGAANFNNTAAMTGLSVSGGNVALGNGFNTGTLTASGGNVNLAATTNALATVGTLDLSTGSPVVNTSPLTGGSVAVTNQLKLPGGTTAIISAGNSFTVGGTNLASSGVASTLTLSGGQLTISASGVASNLVQNGSFETGAPGNYTYDPAGVTGWTFAGGAGTDVNGGPFAAQPSSWGTHYAWCQGNNNSASQTVNITGTGLYTVTFNSIGRGGNNGPDPMSLFVDGTDVLDWTPDQSSVPWRAYTSNAVALGPGPHTISFRGENTTTNDWSSAFDNVAMTGLITGAVNLPNATVAVTASSTLDLGLSNGDTTLGPVALTAGGGAGTTLTLQDANSLTVNGIAATGTSGAATIAGTTPIKNPAGTVDVPAGVTLSIGAPLVDGSGSSANINSLLKTSPGTLVLTASNTYSGGTTVYGGTLQLGNGQNLNGYVQNNITNHAVVAFANPATQSYLGNISGNGGVLMLGPGTFKLANAQGYTGGTSINGGTLEVDSSLSSPTVAVNNGGTLAGGAAGLGSVNNLVVNAGGTLLPGATLTVGALSFGQSNSTASAAMGINVAGVSTSDLCQITGTVNLGTNNGLVLNVSGTPAMAPASYTFLTANNITGSATWNVGGATPTPSGLTTFTVNWKGTAGGGDGTNWSVAKNWDLTSGAPVPTVTQTNSSLSLSFTAGASSPLAVSDVVIGGGATVLGPTAASTTTPINSLTLGGNMGGATLQVAAGNINVTRDLGNTTTASNTQVNSNGTLRIGPPAGQPTYIGAFSTNSLVVAGSVGVASGGSLSVGATGATISAGGSLNMAAGSGGNINTLGISGGVATLGGAQTVTTANATSGSGGTLAANGGSIGALTVSDSTATVSIGGAAVTAASISNNSSVTMSAGTITNASVYDTAGLTANGGALNGLTIEPGYTGTTTINSGATGPANLIVPSGTVNLNNTNQMTSLTVSGGLVTLGGGARTGALTVTGGVVNVVNTAGAVATATTADLSAGPSAVTVNTQAGSLAVTSQLKLADGYTFNYSGGASFTASGANLADNGSPRTVTLSGGMLSMVPPPAVPAVTGLGYFKITGDADSGISSNNIYTHAINPTGGGFSVNGVPFTGAPTGDLAPGSLTPQSYTYTGPGGGTVTIGNSIGASSFASDNGDNLGYSNFGNNTVSPAWNNWNNVTGNMYTLFGHFNYNTQPWRTVVLSGLTPKTWYDVVLYEKQWDTSANRSFQVSYDVGNTGTPQYTQPTVIDQNNPQNTPALANLGIGQQDAWAQSYVYETGPAQTSIALDIFNNQGNSYHFYGVTNQVVPVPSGTVTLPSTSVTVTANSTLDLGEVTSDATLATLNLTASGGAGTTLTVQNANSLTLSSGISASGSSGTAAIAGTTGICIPLGQSVSAASGVTLSIGSVIQDGPNATLTGLNVAGAGTVVLTASNTFSGGTTISSGTLQLGNGGTTGSIPDTGISDNGVLAVNRADTVTITGQISGNGGVLQMGPGTLALNPSGSSGNIYQGGTTVTGGTLSFAAGGLGGGPVVVNPAAGGNTSATLAWNNNATDLTANGLTLQSGTTVFSLNGNSVTFDSAIGGSGALEIGGGTLQCGSGDTGGSLASLTGVKIDGTAVLAFNQVGAPPVSIPISGQGGVLEEAGTLILTNSNNTYQGGTTVTAGATVQVGNGTTAGSLGSGPVLLGNNGWGAALVFNQPALSGGRLNTVSNAISDPGAGQGTVVQLGPGAVALTAANNYTGDTAVLGGELAAENVAAIPSGSLLAVGANGSVVLGTPGAVEPVGSLAGAGPLTGLQPSGSGGQVASPALGGGVNPVPEPGTLALLAAAAACSLAAAWRKRRRA